MCYTLEPYSSRSFVSVTLSNARYCEATGSPALDGDPINVHAKSQGSIQCSCAGVRVQTFLPSFRNATSVFRDNNMSPTSERKPADGPTKPALYSSPSLLLVPGEFSDGIPHVSELLLSHTCDKNGHPPRNRPRHFGSDWHMAACERLHQIGNRTEYLS